MQFRSSYLKYCVGILTVFLLSACFKKFDQIETLNTNMFDREYQGDAWFQLDSAFYFVTPLGTSQTRFEISIIQDRLPGLKPSNIKVEFSSGGSDPLILDFPLSSGGVYEKVIDVPYVGTGEYCVEMGVFVPSDSTIINKFSACRII